MQALAVALGELAEPGGCNAGFLRDDALLVVTVVTDEDDVLASLGAIETIDTACEEFVPVG